MGTNDDDKDAEGHMHTMDDGLWRLLVRRTGAEGLTEEEETQLARRAQADPQVERVAHAVDRITAASMARPAADATAAALDRVHARMRRPARTLRLHPAPVPSRIRRSRPWMLAAAGIVATLAGGTALWRADVASPAVMAERVTHGGERIEFGLADGSHVVLGPESRLHYPERFTGDQRAVTLEGEGFFTVAHDPAHPFIVTAAGATTRAVGTAFAVRAYADEPGGVEVVVTEGRVVVRAPGTHADSGTFLVRGERAVTDQAGGVVVEQGVDVDRAVTWTRGRLTYDRAPVREVVRDMERWYDLDIIVVDSSLAGDRVTITLDHALASDALRRLSTVLGARLERNGRSVRLVP